MSDNWKKFDLAGDGLQSINLEMTRQQKKLPAAVVSWCLFPLGLHLMYLRQYRLFLLWWLTLLVLTAAALLNLLPLVASAIPLVIWALFDLYWLPIRVSQFNKALKMRLYLQDSHTPPVDYRGRYIEDSEGVIEEYTAQKEQERGGHSQHAGQKTKSAQRILSFAEQEALLKAMQQRKKPQHDQD